MRGPVCEKSEIDFINKASVPAPATNNAGERNVHRSVPLTVQAMIPQAAVNTAVSAIMMQMRSGGSIFFPARRDSRRPCISPSAAAVLIQKNRSYAHDRLKTPWKAYSASLRHI